MASRGLMIPPPDSICYIHAIYDPDSRNMHTPCLQRSQPWASTHNRHFSLFFPKKRKKLEWISAIQEQFRTSSDIEPT